MEKIKQRIVMLAAKTVMHSDSAFFNHKDQYRRLRALLDLPEYLDPCARDSLYKITMAFTQEKKKSFTHFQYELLIRVLKFEKKAKKPENQLEKYTKSFELLKQFFENNKDNKPRAHLTTLFLDHLENTLLAEKYKAGTINVIQYYWQIFCILIDRLLRHDLPAPAHFQTENTEADSGLASLDPKEYHTANVANADPPVIARAHPKSTCRSPHKTVTVWAATEYERDKGSQYNKIAMRGVCGSVDNSCNPKLRGVLKK